MLGISISLIQVMTFCDPMSRDLLLAEANDNLYLEWMGKSLRRYMNQGVEIATIEQVVHISGGEVVDNLLWPTWIDVNRLPWRNPRHIKLGHDRSLNRMSIKTTKIYNLSKNNSKEHLWEHL